MINEIIRNRKSTVVYLNKPVEDKKLEAIFEAARWAPSSMNEQPWTFIYGKQENRNSWVKLYNCLKPKNQEWCKNAPVLILSIAHVKSLYNGEPNKYAIHDVALAESAMMYEAVNKGLLIHPMAGFDANCVIKNFDLPDDYVPVTMMALGYKGKINDVNDALKTRELKVRERKHIEEFVFDGEFRTKN